MSYLQAVLLAEARAQARGVRSALFRHRRITERPMGLALWQLGAEPFTVGAAAWGFSPSDRNLQVPGEPRDRELAFRALSVVAREFNPWFESGEPQVVLPNRGTLGLLARLGRRLAYLPTDGDHPADPALVRFGRHLRFLADRSRFPGQQLVLVLTELLRSHWVCELSDVETQSLAALDAAIDPPPGASAHDAAAAAELLSIGPVPGGDEDERLDPLVQEFNAQRLRRTEETIVAPLRQPIVDHYTKLVFTGVWPLLWRCLERERELREAPSVGGRWQQDLDALERHRSWIRQTGGIRRIRQTSAQAAWTLRRWEEAQRLLAGEEALDDRLRMLPFVMSNEALVGRVVQVDLEHRERPKRNLVRRPRVTLALADRCLMPLGKHLFWTATPDKAAYRLIAAAQAPGEAGWHAILQHESGSEMPRPLAGEEAVFSIHHTRADPPLMLPPAAPWTHVRPPSNSASLEDDSDARGWE